MIRFRSDLGALRMVSIIQALKRTSGGVICPWGYWAAHVWRRYEGSVTLECRVGMYGMLRLFESLCFSETMEDCTIPERWDFTSLVGVSGEIVLGEDEVCNMVG